MQWPYEAYYSQFTGLLPVLLSLLVFSPASPRSLPSTRETSRRPLRSQLRLSPAVASETRNHIILDAHQH